MAFAELFNDNLHQLERAGAWLKNRANQSLDNMMQCLSTNEVAKRSCMQGFAGAMIPGEGALEGTSTRVIGHFPEYVEMAEKTGAKFFSVPEKIWNGMSEADRWGANQRFLDRGIASGDHFLMATPLENIRAGSYLEREVNHLFDNGYRINSNGSKLIPRM